ncbi:alpha-D-ribose 1-methylphosphonate 5-triphosphate diphosphatase [Xanthobacter dioxanivorans]|uniref:Alpha-D-ribose 1-methylphosphonate 5-triphosphate diphosphatase n=1 Tax=Xanthobacter dioxanivorans TaxID=2528964 RepID=A0A974PRT9_9HYPH|nr:alpha-D-ribose 1-methylphosphonate 5-triphosphate diphosphatase [Xanthobacter dioxanivorans]QRG08301.1 alpha-D-ribose 1-methylphosphonate 5-triphosphate diphosphatase [Xanthobacter dioxanivorans]
METILTNARLILDDAVVLGTLAVRDAHIAAVEDGLSRHAAAQDCDGDFLAPGIIDLHTDALEGHFVPRPKVFWPDARAAALAHDGQMVAGGVTTVFDAICAGGFDQAKAERRDLFQVMLDAVEAGAGLFRADHRIHLRCEMTDPDLLDLVEPALGRRALALASLMDHTPGARQWRNVGVLRNFLLGIGKEAAEAEREITERTARGRANVARNFAPLAQMLGGAGIIRASHDDTTREHVAIARDAGCTVSEFPTTREAAEAARQAGLATIGGAPNVVRGGSHSGGVAMGELAAAGLLDALASDYVPASLLQAATRLHLADGMPLPRAFALVTRNPAEMAGLADRGRLALGLRADLVRFRIVDGTPVVRQVLVEGERVF